MFRKLTILSVIGLFVFGLMFLFGLFQTNFITALPNLGSAFLCLISLIFFNCLDNLKEQVETHEKRIVKLQEDLHKLENKVNNKDGR